MNRELLDRKNKCSSIPPLRQDGEWKKSPYEKANTFAQKFQEKCSLPEEGIDCPFFGKPDAEMDEFVTMRTRRTEKLLRDLDEKKATGPDRIPAAILKKIASSIALPFTMLCRRMYQEGCWPKIWKHHLICPLFKRGSAFMAGNYRGIHLTSILSKVAEKVIGKNLLDFLYSESFGMHQ